MTSDDEANEEAPPRPAPPPHRRTASAAHRYSAGAVKKTNTGTLQQQGSGEKRHGLHAAAAAAGRSVKSAYSHSMVAGGLEVMSYTTRLTLSTSLTMRTEIFSSTSQGMRAQSAVMPSMDVTARMPTV